jgi:hypothetical protein
MTVEEIKYYKKAANEFIPMGSTIGMISVVSLSATPSELDYYVDFKKFGNLFESERLKDLTLERFFECCDQMMNKRDGYEEWKKKELRDYKLSRIIE